MKCNFCPEQATDLIFLKYNWVVHTFYICKTHVQTFREKLIGHELSFGAEDEEIKYFGNSEEFFLEMNKKEFGIPADYNGLLWMQMNIKESRDDER